MRDRMIQLVALVLVVAGVVAAAVITPAINRQRADLQLSYDAQVGEAVPPEYALAATALGSFRGVLVNVMWHRLEGKKQEGQYFEADTLGRGITVLQPRFPQVWAFLAWNMAYNISVATRTQEERWDWVNKGVRLLREQGIPHNPDAIRLYRELAWIFFHKIGGQTDDMHWYYKTRLATEWTELLGPPPQGERAEDWSAWFEPVAEAAERYFGELIRADEQAMGHDEAATAVAAAVRSERTATASLQRLYEDHPAARNLVLALEDAGRELDQSLLRDLGRLQIMAGYVDLSQGFDPLRDLPDELLPESAKALIPIVLETEQTEAMIGLVHFLRAKVLLREYRMDPRYMASLMDRFGPVDWRHPAAHSLYWSSLGVDRMGGIREDTHIDVVNTYRNQVHSLQSLMHMGRLAYDPVGQMDDLGRWTPTIGLMPEPRFIDGYEDAVETARTALGDEEAAALISGGVDDSFASGHENFLHKAVLFSYLYGNPEAAREYYDRARRLYADADHNERSGRYQLTLDDFVSVQLQQDDTMEIVNRAYIESMIVNALRQGVAQRRGQVTQAFLRQARMMHRAFQEERNRETTNADRTRQGLEPWPQFLDNAAVSYLRSSQYGIQERARVWSASDLRFQQRVYRRLMESVQPQLGETTGSYFPPPPGLTQAPEMLRRGNPGEAPPPAPAGVGQPQTERR
jgi:hypothetical protein